MKNLIIKFFNRPDVLPPFLNITKMKDRQGYLIGTDPNNFLHFKTKAEMMVYVHDWLSKEMK